MVVALVGIGTIGSANGSEPSEGSAPRIPWTQSRLQGSPEPPLPYVFASAFDIDFQGPVSLNRIPHTNQYLVCEQHGRIYAFDGAQAATSKKLCVDLNVTRPPTAAVGDQQRVQLFSVAYHPQFESNRWVYVCYVTQGGGREPQTHISRFDLPSAQPLQLAVDSEVAILKCGGGGHNGCTLAFGNDGYLYISIGDLEVPNPPDTRNTGQDISDLYSSILRIDVERTSPEQNYAIPEDNPFVNLPRARPEVYAYGLRNPFRMSFDAPTGDLWVGDVGWEAWEMVYRVRAGGNYGWAIKEGPGDVKPQTPGPTPILPADIALNHAQAASVTGGMVYRGQRYPDLHGQYVFGDWITRKFWAASFDKERVIDYREIAMGSVKPICFETDVDGELLIMDYSDAQQASGIFRLVPNPSQASQSDAFPRLLSQTGLFEDTASRRPAAGVVPYALNAPMWADGARAEYLLGIPGSAQATFHTTPQTMFAWFKTNVELPQGSVLAKTYSFGEPPQQTPIETQIALKDEQGDWQYYTYRWNAEGNDAQLVEAAGEVATIDVPVTDPLGIAGRTPLPETADQLDWQFGSRTSCRICHTAWTGETIGFIEPQLQQPRAQSDSWRQLMACGVIRTKDAGSVTQADTQNDLTAMVDPSDANQPLDARARAYLHTNCAHCHLNGGNASTTIDISFPKLLAATGLIDQPPLRGDLGLSGASIVAPGRPAESILFARLAKSGAGRMPHIGSQRTDLQAVNLIKQWISQLPTDPAVRNAIDELCAPRQAQVQDQRRHVAISRLLEDYAGAAELAAAIAEGRVPQSAVHEIVSLAMDRPQPIRDLLEPYAAPDQRVQRLGPNFEAADVLALTADAANGRLLFEQGVGTCSSCHRLDGVGRELGPDLSRLAEERRTPAALLKSMMQPSLEIEASYRVLSVLDQAGQVHVGRVLQRDAQHLTLLDAGGNTIAIAMDSVEAEKELTTSLMPEQLLAPLTAQQAADLLAYLRGLR